MRKSVVSTVAIAALTVATCAHAGPCSDRLGALSKMLATSAPADSFGATATTLSRAYEWTAPPTLALVLSTLDEAQRLDSTDNANCAQAIEHFEEYRRMLR
jgi:hypothetical protein